MTYFFFLLKHYRISFQSYSHKCHVCLGFYEILFHTVAATVTAAITASIAVIGAATPNRSIHEMRCFHRILWCTTDWLASFDTIREQWLQWYYDNIKNWKWWIRVQWKGRTTDVWSGKCKQQRWFSYFATLFVYSSYVVDGFW